MFLCLLLFDLIVLDFVVLILSYVCGLPVCMLIGRFCVVCLRFLVLYLLVWLI